MARQRGRGRRTLVGDNKTTGDSDMKAVIGGLALAALFGGAAAAQDKVAIGLSGWTGFAPLTLASEAGIFKKNGLDVALKKIPQASRHLAMAAGDIQCA